MNKLKHIKMITNKLMQCVVKFLINIIYNNKKMAVVWLSIALFFKIPSRI